ncbi:MAG TPA: BatD protein, partial [Flavobacteriaceae bacterium]|nr:BatD protein [Flavobacteriaceae bacterium]
KKQRSMRADVQGLKLRRANKMARKYLAEARKNKHNKVIFYEALERSLHNYLKARLDIQTTQMSKERITKLLMERKVQVAPVLEFEKLLKSCELARYTPTSDVAIRQDYKKAIDTISLIDKQIQ